MSGPVALDCCSANHLFDNLGLLSELPQVTPKATNDYKTIVLTCQQHAYFSLEVFEVFIEESIDEASIEIYVSCFLMDPKFISKIFEISFMHLFLSFSDPHLHKQLLKLGTRNKKKNDGGGFQTISNTL